MATMAAGHSHRRRLALGRLRGAGRPGHLLRLRRLAHEVANLPARLSTACRGAPGTATRRPRATMAGEAQRLHEAPSRRPHGRGLVRMVEQVGDGLGERLGSSGATATPAPARSTVRATSVPGSTLATIGRPAASTEYSLEGTLDAARPRFSGTTWTSAAASTSGRRHLGCMSTKTHVVRPRARRSRSARAAPPPLITKATSGSSAQAAAADRTRSSAWDSPTLPA